MEKFEPRLTSPATNNKYYLHTSAGGLNDCIIIGAKSVLPNCVGYAFGRVYELLGSYPKLSKNNAGGWYDYKDGYERGQVPRVGAIAVWRKIGTTNNWGHVAIIEEVREDNSILTSNSAYQGTRFYLKELKYPYNVNGHEFLGFIYPPYEWYKSLENKTDLPKLSINEIAKEVINGKYGNGTTRKNNLEKAGYNYSEVQQEVNKILGYVPKIKENVIPSNTKYKIGDKVKFDYLYTDSFGSRCLKSIIHSGTITKVYDGRKAPYLINNGSGFLSNDLIIDKL